jgi:hypothetical protein
MKKIVLISCLIACLVIPKIALSQFISPDTRMIFVFSIPLGKKITEKTIYQGFKSSFASVITEDYRTTFEMLEAGGEEGNPLAKHWVYNEPLAYAMGTTTILGVLGFLDWYRDHPDKKVSKLRKITSYLFLGTMIAIETEVIHGNIDIAYRNKTTSSPCKEPAMKEYWRIIFKN